MENFGNPAWSIGSYIKIAGKVTGILLTEEGYHYRIELEDEFNRKQYITLDYKRLQYHDRLV